eukprot:2924396-Heterocapsa_arctica.AAC.1
MSPLSVRAKGEPRKRGTSLRDRSLPAGSGKLRTITSRCSRDRRTRRCRTPCHNRQTSCARSNGTRRR